MSNFANETMHILATPNDDEFESLPPAVRRKVRQFESFASSKMSRRVQAGQWETFRPRVGKLHAHVYRLWAIASQSRKLPIPSVFVGACFLRGAAQNSPMRNTCFLNMIFFLLALSFVLLCPCHMIASLPFFHRSRHGTAHRVGRLLRVATGSYTVPPGPWTAVGVLHRRLDLSTGAVGSSIIS